MASKTNVGNINTTETKPEIRSKKKKLTTTPLQYPCWHDWHPSASKRNPSPLPNLPAIHGVHVVSFNAANLFEYIPEIKQFKVIQEEIGSITIQYIKSENDFNSTILIKATKELQKHIKDVNFEIKYVEVNYIAPTKSGKPQIIESKIKKQ